MQNEQISFLVLLIIATNLGMSYYGFKNLSFQEKFLLHVRSVVIKKEYFRLISAGFLHADWTHIIFNMMSLWFFASNVGLYYGLFPLIIIYLGSLLMGNLLAVILNKTHFEYRALGASGAVSGIIFASVFAFPKQMLLIWFIPMPAWLFAIGYVLFSIYGIQKKSDHIGHEAHLGGAISGILLAALFQPNLCTDHWLLFLCLLVPTIVFLVGMQLQWNFKSIKINSVRKKQLEEFRKNDFSIESELNYLLDKISENGYNSLSSAEKYRLDQLSKKNKK
jgi:membrane associated rhomboid family serine protease